MPDDDADWDDHPELADREEQELTADIVGIMAGRTVVPAAAMWWRARRERRAERDTRSADPSERTRPPRWFEI